jgi:hypothetical protein
MLPLVRALRASGRVALAVDRQGHPARKAQCR